VLRLAGIACALLLVAALPAASATHALALVTRAADGSQANGTSVNPRLSGDGRFLAFDSDASNLVPDDTNQARDVFLRDLRTGRTTRIAERSYAPSITADGRWTTYCRAAPAAGWNVYVYDRVTRSRGLVDVDLHGRPAPATMETCGQSIAAGGRYVLLWSNASRLVRHDANEAADLFVRDLRLHRTRLVATNARGVHASYEVDPGGMTADGRYVAFCTTSQNLLPHQGDLRSPQDYLKDLQTGALRYASTTPAGKPVGRGSCAGQTLSADGRWLAFAAPVNDLMPGVQNTWNQLWLKDLRTGRVQLATPGTTGHGITWSVQLMSLSANGRVLVFISGAADVMAGVPGTTGSQVYRYDRVTRRTELLTARPDGTPQSSFAIDANVSADGKVVAFSSQDDRLVPNDTNDEDDIFLWH
jgi:Tol biopolymer transport system component